MNNKFSFYRFPSKRVEDLALDCMSHLFPGIYISQAQHAINIDEFKKVIKTFQKYWNIKYHGLSLDHQNWLNCQLAIFELLKKGRKEIETFKSDILLKNNLMKNKEKKSTNEAKSLEHVSEQFQYEYEKFSDSLMELNQNYKLKLARLSRNTSKSKNEKNTIKQLHKEDYKKKFDKIINQYEKHLNSYQKNINMNKNEVITIANNYGLFRNIKGIFANFLRKRKN